jgi:acetyl esterase/lipase
MIDFLRELAEQLPVSIETISVEGVTVYDLLPDGSDPDDQRVFLDMHGGALITGGGDSCRGMGAMAAMRNGIRTWSVDYRMPPDHPYPAALDDCVAVYRGLLRHHRASRLVVGGSSAGGNLAAALILRVRDEGLPMPAAAVLSTPEVDLTESGDSFNTNLGVDTTLTESLMPANLLYADGHELMEPYLSPLFGDFTKGFCPTLLSTGTRDLFLSNTVRMHRALRNADIPAELHVIEAAPHGGFFGSSPEDAEIGREVRRFIGEHCPAD